MKKSFWEYDPQEVDETVEYLEASNAKLEKQVRLLNSELEELRLKKKTTVHGRSAEAQELQKTERMMKSVLPSGGGEIHAISKQLIK